MMAKEEMLLILLPGFILSNLGTLCFGSQLRVGFYRGKCGVFDVEVMVASIVTGHFLRDPHIVAALMRLQFHDCFVNGCDASILIDGKYSEKTAIPNKTILGYDVIDEAKSSVERLCPGIVSCADIIAIAARDAVFLSGGGRYEVQTGRRDGVVSRAEDVNIPGPSATVSSTIEAFVAKGLSYIEMVVLLGAHSVGKVHCSTINERLYNYNKTGRADPAMDPVLATKLRSSCHWNNTVDHKVDLDQAPFSPIPMGISYYRQLMLNRGVLQIDQAIAKDPSTRAVVQRLANGFDFPIWFGSAMVKLGAVGVLTGEQGEIRISCRATNKGH